MARRAYNIQAIDPRPSLQKKKSVQRGVVGECSLCTCARVCVGGGGVGVGWLRVRGL